MSGEFQHLDEGIKRNFSDFADREIHDDLKQHTGWEPWNSLSIFNLARLEEVWMKEVTVQKTGGHDNHAWGAGAAVTETSFFLSGEPIKIRMDVTPPKVDSIPTSRLSVRNSQQRGNDRANHNASDNIRYIESGQTTLVLRNVPKHYTLEGLLSEWRPTGSYDLIYYPYNLKSKRRIGFCFINFVSHQHALEFQCKWHGRIFPNHRDALPFDITAANLQGAAATLERFRGKRIELMSDVEYLPAVFRGKERLDVRDVLVDLGLVEVSTPRRVPA